MPTPNNALTTRASPRGRVALPAGRVAGGRFLDASVSRAVTQRGAFQRASVAARVHQKGVDFRISHAFSFDQLQPVIQQVIPSYLFMEAPMEQLELRLLGRLDAPSVVPHSALTGCKSYREAVRLCWNLRRVRNMTQARLAEEAGLYAPHVTGYLHDNNRQRDLPGQAVARFESVCGNTAITQWMALQAKLTVMEEIQVERAAA